MRKALLITELLSGITFRFLYDRADATQLHIVHRWNVTPEQAIRVFFDPDADELWLEDKRCYETRGATHILAWLWEDEQHQSVFVITCVPRAATEEAEA